MMCGHTKGPWRLDDATRHAGLCTDGYHVIDAGDCVNAPDKGYVGFCVSGFMSDDDGRLIAAAPDLLAALEDCALQIAQTRNRKLTYDEQSALDKARTALALARGAA